MSVLLSPYCVSVGAGIFPRPLTSSSNPLYFSKALLLLAVIVKMLLQMQFFHYLFRIWFFCFFNNVISNILNIFKYIEDLPCFFFFGGGYTFISSVSKCKVCLCFSCVSTTDQQLLYCICATCHIWCHCVNIGTNNYPGFMKRNDKQEISNRGPSIWYFYYTPLLDVSASNTSHGKITWGLILFNSFFV